MREGRFTEATYNGRTYSIPKYWLMGFCRDGATLLDAVEWWAYQDELERQYGAS